MKPPTLDDLRAYWGAYASIFERALESSTVLLARALMAHLHLSEARAVLEVGSGPGAAAAVLHQELPAGARLVVTDLSPDMLARARARLPDPVEVSEANCEELPYGDGSFDRLLANLILMLTPDPARALAEAHRVLQPGGLAAWSVWGRQDLSHMFTIPPRAAERVGIPLPPRRSNFYLGDREALRERVASHGFDRVLAWYQPMMPGWRDGQSFADITLATPRWQQCVADQPEAKVVALRDEIARMADERLAAGEAIGLDALIVVARRP